MSELRPRAQARPVDRYGLRGHAETCACGCAVEPRNVIPGQEVRERVLRARDRHAGDCAPPRDLQQRKQAPQAAQCCAGRREAGRASEHRVCAVTTNGDVRSSSCPGEGHDGGRERQRLDESRGHCLGTLCSNSLCWRERE